MSEKVDKRAHAERGEGTEIRPRERKIMNILGQGSEMRHCGGEKKLRQKLGTSKGQG